MAALHIKFAENDISSASFPQIPSIPGSQRYRHFRDISPGLLIDC